MMKPLLVFALSSLFFYSVALEPGNETQSLKIPFTLDHNRMLVRGEMQKSDGSWRKVLFWVDSGNPDFFISGELAKDLGTDLSGKKTGENGYLPPLEITPPSGIRLGSQDLDFSGIKSKVMFGPGWIFGTMHIDANIPSTLLKKYHVIIDYPGRTISLADAGSLKPKGTKLSAVINSKTGIVQLDAVIDGDSLSLAFDIGASYSFISGGRLKRLTETHPAWPSCTGAAGCANIWGWWPDEQSWPVTRLPEITLGTITLRDIGMAGLPDFFSGGESLGEWYSRKTAKPVAGFLGPNAFKNCRLEIDYANNAVYLEQRGEPDRHDMDLVGITVRLDPDSNYQVVGVALKDGVLYVEGIVNGDLLIQVDGFKTRGATMGTVVDALRGRPGEEHVLTLERNGVQFKVSARVQRLL